MGDFTVTIDDLNVRLALDDAARALRDTRPAWVAAGEVLLERVEQNFRSQQAGVSGEKWAPLKDETLNRRRAGRNTRARVRKLQDTGRLKGSVTTKAYQDRVEIGSNLVYAATHQFGRDNIPARPFITIDEPDIKEIEQTLLDHILDR